MAETSMTLTETPIADCAVEQDNGLRILVTANS